jgi:hypothetical protein
MDAMLRLGYAMTTFSSGVCPRAFGVKAKARRTANRSVGIFMARYRD